MPCTLKNAVRYWITAVDLVQQQMHVRISTAVPLNAPNVAELAADVLAKAFYEPLEHCDYCLSPVSKLFVWIERFEFDASNEAYLTGDGEVVEFGFRTKCESGEPRPIRCCNLTRHSLGPTYPPKYETRCTASAANRQVDKNRT